MAETFTIRNEKIFKSGIWHGDEYDDSDLDSIIDSFGKEISGFKVPIKLGHNNKQKLLIEDGLPAAGWIENLKKVGEDILCDFVDIPKKIYTLIKNKAYQAKSSEIYRDFKALNGKKYKTVLKAVSILGEDIPEVSNLNDIMSLYDSEQRQYTVITLENNLTNEQNSFSHNQEEEMADKKVDVTLAEDKEKELLAKIKILEEKLSKFKSDDNEKNKFSKEVEDLKTIINDTTSKLQETQSQLDVEVFKNREKDVDTQVSKFISDKKITPAQGDDLKSILLFASNHSGKIKYFSKGEKSEDKIFSEVVTDFLEKQFSATLSDDEVTKKGEDTDMDVEERIKKYCKDEGLDIQDKEHYKQAYIAVGDGGK